MADRTSRLAAALTAEFIIRSEFKSSSVSEELTASRQQQIVQLQAIKNSASLSDILIAEKTILAFELHHYANTATMKSSITAALADIAIAEQLAAVIVDPAAYKAVDQSHSRPKNRANHLPLDEARQFFSSHSTRLLNLDKGRLDLIDKKIIDAPRQYADRRKGVYRLTAGRAWHHAQTAEARPRAGVGDVNRNDQALGNLWFLGLFCLNFGSAFTSFDPLQIFTYA